MAGLSVSKSASFRKANSVAPTFPTNSATPNPTIMNTTTQQVRSQIRKRHVPDYLDQPAPEDEMREMTYDIILDEADKCLFTKDYDGAYQLSTWLVNREDIQPYMRRWALMVRDCVDIKENLDNDPTPEPERFRDWIDRAKADLKANGWLPTGIKEYNRRMVSLIDNIVEDVPEREVPLDSDEDDSMENDAGDGESGDTDGEDGEIEEGGEHDEDKKKTEG